MTMDTFLISAVEHQAAGNVNTTPSCALVPGHAQFSPEFDQLAVAAADNCDYVQCADVQWQENIHTKISLLVITEYLIAITQRLSEKDLKEVT